MSEAVQDTPQKGPNFTNNNSSSKQHSTREAQTRPPMFKPAPDHIISQGNTCPVVPSPDGRSTFRISRSLDTPTGDIGHWCKKNPECDAV
ncbi:hypothetical protein E2C01_067179 [Portunus trituberculatus]|uniref:Uncharacterized protein n=1 Tax=Portunus trituberculatus TaxID=210409 RepID=A0A5B7HSY2_PORTR|nr:hypothetical protein [Portunus trituberculatus]